ncbi:hypothetical protein IGS68_09460 [Skermanella sp. TT6]|uniref:Uncharacterized protein n=1 Tax=Skermanella cutis TaxID=2775420 RepID=A0ABX7BB53_9PROT|nr:hypothetical protein [Skermanella sp. TT6]QQP91407.1 hypothetical protein IGS68_09460 [Skermanella sp. TT6]
MTKNGLSNSGEPDDRRPGSMIMGTARIIDFQRAAAARTGRSGERRSPRTDGLGVLQARIGSLRHQVDLLSVHLGLMQCRLELMSFSIQETTDFCADCHEAMAMTDIDAMERARDDLRDRLGERAALWRNPADFRFDAPPA